MKIDLSKKYKTRDGHDVELYTVSATDEMYPVVGGVLFSNGADMQRWNSEGQYYTGTDRDLDGEDPTHSYDLFEVTPVWSGKIWVHDEEMGHVIPEKVGDLISYDLKEKGWRLINVVEVK